MDNYITRAEHTEFSRRMEDEHKRISHRLEDVENVVEKIYTLTSSVEKLAVSVQQLAEGQKEQSERLATLESRDGEKWRTAVKYVITAVLGAVVALVFKQIGLS